jgi:hypothetical protein
MRYETHYNDAANLSLIPGQRMRHRPTGREGKFVKTVTVKNKQYLLCQADDRQGTVVLCFAAGDWEHAPALPCQEESAL